MKFTKKKAYSPRINGMPSSCLRVRLEANLAEELKAAQSLPELRIKKILIPSTSLIVRRALTVYLEMLAGMKPHQLEQENLHLHKLA